MRLGCEEHQAAAMRAQTVGNQGLSPAFWSWGTLEEPCLSAAEGCYFSSRGPPLKHPGPIWVILITEKFIVSSGF